MSAELTVVDSQSGLWRVMEIEYISYNPVKTTVQELETFTDKSVAVEYAKQEQDKKPDVKHRFLFVIPLNFEEKFQ